MIYLQLFISFFQVGILSFGGGYAALPLIQRQVVEVRQWVSPTEFSDIITISQMTPGPIALNMASFVGTKMGGIPGTVTATVSVVVGPFILALILAVIYYRYRELGVMKGILYGLKPTVVSLIATAGIGIFITAMFEGGGLSDVSPYSLLMFTLALTLLLLKRISPLLTILLCGGAMLVLELVLSFFS